MGGGGKEGNMTTLAVLAVLLAQAAPAADVEVRAVSLTVTDDKGNAVEGLAAEDVALLENGVAWTWREPARPAAPESGPP